MSSETNNDGQSGIAVIKNTKLQRPRMYKVIMHNDDYTTMEFVILVLKKYFNKTAPEAQSIMLEVHIKGFATCGIYTHEIAESKSAKVIKYARENGHPLKCSIDPCDS
jgi:ATP-dependent Clp protease adaptor protein ClpS